MNTLGNKELYIKINSHKKIKVSEAIYIFALSIYLINSILYTTMFNVYMKSGVTVLINIIMSCMIAFKIIMFDKYSLKNITLVGILFVFFNLGYLKSGYNNLFYLPLLIIGAKNVDFDKICKSYLFIGVSIVIIAMIAVKLGVIEHIVYFRDGRVRYSFGSVYATDFAARIFFLCATYCYLKQDKLKLINSIAFIIIGSFTLYYCGARLDSISIFMLSIVPLIGIKMYKNKKKIGKLVKYIMVLAIPISAIVSVVVTNMYNPSNYTTVLLNKIFSDRLALGKRGILEYGFSLFGQTIEMKGNGGISVSMYSGISDYFFIDSSYLYIGLRYGLIILLMVCIYYSLFIKNRIEKGDILLPILLMIIGINSIVAHHLIDVAYNPFILVFFSNLMQMNSSKNHIDYKEYDNMKAI